MKNFTKKLLNNLGDIIMASLIIVPTIAIIASVIIDGVSKL